MFRFLNVHFHGVILRVSYTNIFTNRKQYRLNSISITYSKRDIKHIISRLVATVA